jgi:hypothetical protein
LNTALENTEQLYIADRCSSTIQKERAVAFSWQQLLRKQTIKLRYTYVAYLVLSGSQKQALFINATFRI